MTVNNTRVPFRVMKMICTLDGGGGVCTAPGTSKMPVKCLRQSGSFDVT